MKITTLSAPQKDGLNLIFVKDINIIVHISSCDLKRKFMICSPVANLMHHPLLPISTSDKDASFVLEPGKEWIQLKKVGKNENLGK